MVWPGSDQTLPVSLECVTGGRKCIGLWRHRSRMHCDTRKVATPTNAGKSGAPGTLASLRKTLTNGMALGPGVRRLCHPSLPNAFPPDRCTRMYQAAAATRELTKTAQTRYGRDTPVSLNTFRGPAANRNDAIPGRTKPNAISQGNRS
jgi:hypothetical protein